ncbi:uncharacterized protein LOC114352619 [Ostrinia furnacalis]|uniref:uncharacterized protein LOC114352619 n=1 Tax=Ostrinia furnacalis TaxID=93504 RepID=UPI00103DFD42|nr:uncharacterized protein LOC114352619 [Ostrinia furnacalis]
MANAELQAELEELRAKNAILQSDLQKARLEPKQESSNDQVCRVSVKLPPFWTDRPTIWFAQVEAQFHLAGITTDMTKFSHVIGAIDQRVIGEIEDIVMNPPEENKYLKLKEELIRRLSTSEEQRVRRLLSDEELGDRKPSTFLRHLKSLAGSTLKDEGLLRQLWLRRLPNQVQAILAAQADLSLDKLADLADRITEVTPGPANVFAVNSAPTLLSSLVECVENLTKQVAALTKPKTRREFKSKHT